VFLMDTRERKERRQKARKGPAQGEGRRTGAPVAAGLTPMGIGLGVAGVVVAILGLVLVARGDITAAPLLLVLAYLVLFPLALTR
jgi:hypothetical protein